MFLMASGAGTIAHDVGLMKRMARVAFFATLIDALIRELQRRAREKFFWRFMALRAVGSKLGVMLGNGARIIQRLGLAKEKPSHDRAANERNEKNAQKAQPPPVMRLLEIIEVALKALGNLLLRSSIESHFLCVVLRIWCAPKVKGTGVAETIEKLLHGDGIHGGKVLLRQLWRYYAFDARQCMKSLRPITVS